MKMGCLSGSAIVTTPISFCQNTNTFTFGFDFYQALVVTGVGTAIHHLIDSAIT